MAKTEPAKKAEALKLTGGYKPTHKELVARAERWLRNSKGCPVVLTELVTGAGEIPDAIGWKGAYSTLIECKTSRSDFFNDSKKDARRLGLNMGAACYYLTPPGLVKPEEVPSYWGLLEAGPRSVKVLKKSKSRSIDGAGDYDQLMARQNREIVMLVSALRRAGGGKVR